MRRVLAAGLIAALAALAAPVGADAPKTMGEAAAATKKKKPAKVYTEDDLHNHGRTGTYSEPPAGGGPPTGTPSTAASPAAGDKKPGDKPAAAPSEKPKTEDELRADQEKEWRDKLTQAQADVATWTGEVSRLQTALNDTS